MRAVKGNPKNVAQNNTLLPDPSRTCHTIYHFVLTSHPRAYRCLARREETVLKCLKQKRYGPYEDKRRTTQVPLVEGVPAERNPG